MNVGYVDDIVILTINTINLAIANRSRSASCKRQESNSNYGRMCTVSDRTAPRSA